MGLCEYVIAFNEKERSWTISVLKLKCHLATNTLNPPSQLENG